MRAVSLTADGIAKPLYNICRMTSDSNGNLNIKVRCFRGPSQPNTYCTTCCARKNAKIAELAKLAKGQFDQNDEDRSALHWNDTRFDILRYLEQRLFV